MLKPELVGISSNEGFSGVLIGAVVIIIGLIIAGKLGLLPPLTGPGA